MKKSIVCVWLALLAACVPREANQMARAADPAIPGSKTSYQSVTSETRTFRPAEPKGWEDLNRRVGPKQ